MYECVCICIGIVRCGRCACLFLRGLFVHVCSALIFAPPDPTPNFSGRRLRSSGVDHECWSAEQTSLHASQTHWRERNDAADTPSGCAALAHCFLALLRLRISAIRRHRSLQRLQRASFPNRPASHRIALSARSALPCHVVALRAQPPPPLLLQPRRWMRKSAPSSPQICPPWLLQQHRWRRRGISQKRRNRPQQQQPQQRRLQQHHDAEEAGHEQPQQLHRSQRRIHPRFSNDSLQVRSFFPSAAVAIQLLASDRCVAASPPLSLSELIAFPPVCAVAGMLWAPISAAHKEMQKQNLAELKELRGLHEGLKRDAISAIKRAGMAKENEKPCKVCDRKRGMDAGVRWGAMIRSGAHLLRRLSFSSPSPSGYRVPLSQIAGGVS